MAYVDPELDAAQRRALLAMNAARHPEGALPSTHRGGTVTMKGDVVLDGNKVGSFMARQLAKDFSAPPTGTTSFDFRVTPYANSPAP